MNLGPFRTFVKVVETQNLSRAAAELGLSQPAVSKQIQALEDHYGVLLMERSGRKLKLTEAGEALYACAMELLRVMEKTARTMEDISESRRGKLYIGTSTIPGQYLIPRIIKSFKARYPNVAIFMDMADTEKIYTRVAEREMDLGIVGAWLGNRKVDGFKWAEDELLVLVPANHRLAQAKEVAIGDLLKERWLFREKGSGTRVAVEEMLGRVFIRKEDLNIQAEVGSTSAMVAAVEADLGISIVSSLVISHGSAGQGVIGLKLANDVGKRDLFVIYPKQKHRRVTVERFLDFLRNNESGEGGS